jgi:hypothetical protein
MTRGGERCEAWGGATPPPTSASSKMSPINQGVFAAKRRLYVPVPTHKCQRFSEITAIWDFRFSSRLKRYAAHGNLPSHRTAEPTEFARKTEISRAFKRCPVSIKVFQNRLCVRKIDFLDSILAEIGGFSRVLVFH